MAQRYMSNVASITSGAPIEPSGEEFASATAQSTNYAATRGAHIEPSREEFTSATAQRPNVAATRGASKTPLGKEFVGGTARRLNVAATRGASTRLEREEFASATARRTNVASITRGAPTKTIYVAFVGGMVRILYPPPRTKLNGHPSLPGDTRAQQQVPSL